MRIVLYDDETMEALTVLHLERWMADRLKERERIYLPVVRPVSARPIRAVEVPINEIVADRVMIWFEHLHRNGERHWLAFTRDSRHALSLKSVFLPGQWSAVHAEYARGITEGIVRALGTMLR